MKDIAIYGAGAFGREIACLLRRINLESNADWNLIGFFDDVHSPGDTNEYGTVLGNMETLNAWPRPLSLVFAIGSAQAIHSLHSKISNCNISFPNIISPDTLFLDRNNVRMGIGNVICSRCLISCNVDLGNFNIFNWYITVGHDVVIGNYNAVMPSVNISGNVSIGDRNFFGANSVILPKKHIGSDTTVGASALITRDTEDGKTYVGVPARIMQAKEPRE